MKRDNNVHSPISLYTRNIGFTLFRKSINLMKDILFIRAIYLVSIENVFDVVMNHEVSKHSLINLMGL